VIYLDSSALVKLVIEEDESTGLQRHLPKASVKASCVLAHVEVIRAGRRRDRDSGALARRVLEEIDLLAVDGPVLDAAAELEDEWLRSLDAIHMAAALSLGDDLTELITYDHRMVAAAEGLGIPVSSPA